MDSLNMGADVTKGLRKVDKSEMTHKNPALRGQRGSKKRKINYVKFQYFGRVNCGHRGN